MPSAAEKLLERMRRSKQGWGPDDLHTLYVGFGFWYREGKGHRVYIHDRFTELRTTVSRHTPMPVGYVQTAIKLVDKARALETGRQERGEATE